MACTITGRLVTPSGAPHAASTLRLTPVPPVVALPGGAVMVGPVEAASGSDGTLDVVVDAPEGVTWTVQLTVRGVAHVARPGVVLPQDGQVSLAWLLGLTATPTPGQGVVVSPDGATFTAPAIAVAEGTFTITGAVGGDGATYTIQTGGADG